MDSQHKNTLYSDDLCRAVDLTFVDAGVDVDGTNGYKFKIDKSNFANSTEKPENWCFETGSRPLPSGVFNASACRFGAPIFMSQPHFYEADPYYASRLSSTSVKPAKNKHESYFVFEPTSGVAMEVMARFQVNVMITKIPELDGFKHLSGTTYLPVIWFENSLVLPKPITQKMWYLGNLKSIQIGAGCVIIGVFAVVFILGAFSHCALKSQARAGGKYDEIQDGDDNESPILTTSGPPTEIVDENDQAPAPEEVRSEA